MQSRTCPFVGCNQIFMNEGEFIEHKLIKHQLEKIQLSPEKLQKYDKLYQKSDKKKCTICYREMTPTMNWKRHLATHSNQREFTCTICFKTFSRADNMKNHKRRHLAIFKDPEIADIHS